MGAQNFSQQITGLTPDTTYHYKITARNAAGIYETEDLTFTTAAATFSPLDIDWKAFWWVDGQNTGAITAIADATGNGYNLSGNGTVVAWQGRKAFTGTWTAPTIGDPDDYTLLVIGQKAVAPYTHTPITTYPANGLKAAAAPSGWQILTSAYGTLDSAVAPDGDPYYVIARNYAGGSGAKIAVKTDVPDVTGAKKAAFSAPSLGESGVSLAAVGIYWGDLFVDDLFDDLCDYIEDYWVITGR